MESPTYSDDGNVHLLASLDVPDLVADVDDFLLPQVEFFKKVEEGPVLAEEVLFGVDEVEDVQDLGPEELLDVLPRVRSQDPHPDPPSFQVEDKLLDTREEAHLTDPLVEFLLGAQDQVRNLYQGDLIFLDDFQVGHAPELVDVRIGQGFDIEFLGVLVNEPDDGRERIGDGAIEVKNHG